jgi:hypothetical protein
MSKNWLDIKFQIYICINFLDNISVSW